MRRRADEVAGPRLAVGVEPGGGVNGMESLVTVLDEPAEFTAVTLTR